jgi:hypothetical protein
VAQTFQKTITQAQEIVKANGFEDKITLIHGKVEDVSLPVAQVDVNHVHVLIHSTTL